MLATAYFFSLFQSTDAAAGTADFAPVIALVIAHALMLTPIVKVAVDVVVKMMIGSSSRWIPLAAALMGVVCAILLNGASGVPPTVKAVSLAILTGASAGGGAVGLTEVHKKASDVAWAKQTAKGIAQIVSENSGDEQGDKTDGATP